MTNRQRNPDSSVNDYSDGRNPPVSRFTSSVTFHSLTSLPPTSHLPISHTCIPFTCNQPPYLGHRFKTATLLRLSPADPDPSLEPEQLPIHIHNYLPGFSPEFFFNKNLSSVWDCVALGSHTVCNKHPQQFTGQFPGLTLTCCTCWVGWREIKICADGFSFPYWHYRIFSFPPLVPRLVYSLSNHPNTCVYVWNITPDLCTSVPPHFSLKMGVDHPSVNTQDCKLTAA